MDEERLASLKKLEERLGYQFKRIEWLDQALTHKSFIYPTNTPRKVSNEVLEFLGDAVINLTVSDLLLQRFPEDQEGTLSIKRSHLVKQGFLALLSKEIGLQWYILLGKSEIIDGGRKKSSILANTYEALIGAIYMDSGFYQASKIIQNHIEPFLESESFLTLFTDYKSLLQNYVQKNHGISPKYIVMKESGPDHNKQFQASVVFSGEIKGIGWGRSKKSAEQEAAKNALQEIEKNSNDPNQGAKEPI